MRLNIFSKFSKKLDVSPFVKRLTQLVELPDEDFGSRISELETIFAEYSAACLKQEKEPAADINSRFLEALLDPSVQRPERSWFQMLLLRSQELPASYQQVVVALYAVWENSRYNPARPGTDISRFDYALFGMKPFQLPYQSPEKQYPELPIWRLRGKVLHCIDLDEVVVRDRGLNRQQVCVRGTDFLGQPIEKVHDKAVQPFQVIRDDDSGAIIQFMAYDGDIPETYRRDPENAQATLRIRYDRPLLGEVHLYCPVLLYGYDAEQNRMSTIYMKAAGKEGVIQPIPLFLIDFLSREVAYSGKLYIPLPDELALEEKTITQELPLSQYRGLEFLRRSSLMHYFMSSETFVQRSDQDAFLLARLGSRQSVLSCGVMNLIAKVIQKPEYAGEPWFDSVVRLAVVLENASLDLYGIYTQAELAKAIKKFSEATADSTFDKVSIPYRQRQ